MAFQAKRHFTRRVGREAVKLLSSRGVEYAVFEDISAGGLRLRMERKVAEGSRFHAEFLLPYKGQGRYEQMIAEIEVLRCSPVGDHYELGARFCYIDAPSQKALENTIDCTPGSF